MAKSTSPTDRLIDELRSTASRVLVASQEAADELEKIVEESLPRNASQGLRTHLRQVIVRLRDTSSVLARELDSAVADPEIVGWLVRVLKRTASLGLAGSMFITAAVATGALEKTGADLLPGAEKRLTAIVDAANHVDDLGFTDRTSGSSDSPERSESELLRSQFAMQFTGTASKCLRSTSARMVGRKWLNVFGSFSNWSRCSRTT
jgi:hypothetical protein